MHLKLSICLTFSMLLSPNFLAFLWIDWVIFLSKSILFLPIIWKLYILLLYYLSSKFIMHVYKILSIVSLYPTKQCKDLRILEFQSPPLNLCTVVTISVIFKISIVTNYYFYCLCLFRFAPFVYQFLYSPFFIVS